MKLSTAITKDGKKITNLQFDFDKITGNDIVAAEREARMMGDTTPDVAYSKTFQAIISAKAVDQSLIADDILSLNGKDFMAVTNQAANFLFGWALPAALQKH